MRIPGQAAGVLMVLAGAALPAAARAQPAPVDLDQYRIKSNDDGYMLDGPTRFWIDADRSRVITNSRENGFNICQSYPDRATARNVWLNPRPVGVKNMNPSHLEETLMAGPVGINKPLMDHFMDELNKFTANGSRIIPGDAKGDAVLPVPNGLQKAAEDLLDSTRNCAPINTNVSELGWHIGELAYTMLPALKYTMG